MCREARLGRRVRPGKVGRAGRAARAGAGGLLAPVAAVATAAELTVAVAAVGPGVAARGAVIPARVAREGAAEAPTAVAAPAVEPAREVRVVLRGWAAWQVRVAQRGRSLTLARMLTFGGAMLRKSRARMRA